ncbi:MAG: hypothetical protein JWM74_2483 [Myxococcaceae bacterium]|nr:hypothetical protein [Myxococcaceae bacterium]
MRCCFAAPCLGLLAGLAALGRALPAAADVSAPNAPGDASRTLSESLKWIAMKADAKRDYGDRFEQGAPMVLLSSARPAAPSPEGKVDDTSAGALPRLRASVIARDWGGSYAIVGSDLPCDNIRLTRSSRMLVSRMSLGDWKITPWAHVAIGEWRYDPNLLPLMPHNQEYATQLSGGLAFELFMSTRLVWEADYTVLLRSSRDPEDLPAVHVIGTFAILETRL